MQYCRVWLRGVRDIFTWQSDQGISVGDRIEVLFRGRKKIGIVLDIVSDKPSFKTSDVVEIVEQNFLSKEYLQLLSMWADKYFVGLPKMLSLVIPEAFLYRKDPVKKIEYYSLLSGVDLESIRGEKQKCVVELLLKKKEESLDELRTIASLSTIRSLEKKEIFSTRIGKILPGMASLKTAENYPLTSDQEKALKVILSTKEPTLLFGVTGSGKTEVYKHAATKYLSQDEKNQVVLLVPEISLTPQLIGQFQSIEGVDVAVWHSNMSAGEKVQEWDRIRSGEARIIIGTRSMALLPFQKPAFIILDEEHEWTFKNEFAPRFWTHEIVQDISQNFGAKVVFGSATPRVESFINVETGKWNIAVLKNRVQETLLPDIEVVDLTNESKKGNFGPISEKLLQEIITTIKNGKQVILFLNKRGFSGATLCRICGHTFECPNCSANMKMHQKVFFDKGMQNYQRKFLCHTCGHLERFPEMCPGCSSKDFHFRGWGTQQVEEVLLSALPKIRILRADKDAVTGRYDFEKILDDFHAHKADVLLGTQMIAKGLDFERVHLVGLILADVGLSLPDFRSEERVFQLLSQVSGRAGRRTEQGKIILQTYRREEPIFSFLRNHDTEKFVEAQIDERKSMNLPPFSVVTKITFSDSQKETAFYHAKQAQSVLKTSLPEEQGIYEVHFAPAFFPRSHGKYHFHVFLRTPNESEALRLLQMLDLGKPGMKIDLHPSSML